MCGKKTGTQPFITQYLTEFNKMEENLDPIHFKIDLQRAAILGLILKTAEFELFKKGHKKKNIYTLHPPYLVVKNQEWFDVILQLLEAFKLLHNSCLIHQEIKVPLTPNSHKEIFLNS